MLTKEQNDALTLTGPGMPGGDLLRRYWQPIALARELPVGGDPLSIDILGEELVLFRDEDARLGLLHRHCCHRGSDLSFGRVECGGLRCLYHGWVFDVNGKCLEQPLEPRDSTFKDKVRQPSYPVIERAGAFFAYMGPGEAPEFPAYDFFNYPADHVSTNKIFVDCNYMQANEGNYDPAHVGVLHRSFINPPNGLAFGNLMRRGVTDISDLKVDAYETPVLKVEQTRFGIRIFQIRSGGPNKTYLRVTNFGMPNFSVIGGPQGGDGHIGIWHVPINDHCHWRWGFALRRDKPIDAGKSEGARAPSAAGREGPEFEDEFHHRRKRANRYLQDRSKLSENYTGMGPVFGVHDAFATESMGSIADRTIEHLATSDIAVATVRRLMLRAVEDVRAGKEPLGVVRDAAANDFSDLMSFDVLIPDTADPSEVTREIVAELKVAAE
jgi:phenylpropionate dioxygenase-like ring-hydroxylating dioxygenase large terminal subunit